MVISNRMMIDRSNDVARENTAADEQRPHYVIKLRKAGVYAQSARLWTPSLDDAMRFDFMTSALGFAFTHLELGAEEFDVECVSA